MRFFWPVSLAIVCICASASAATVTVRSGNGSIGGTDSAVTFLLGPAATDFPILTGPDFTAAQGGSAASVINNHAFWLVGLAEDVTAKWIGTNTDAATNGNTALYAVNFNIPTAFTSATLNVNAAVDNQFGGTNLGVYVNGNGIAGTTGGTFNVESHFLAIDITNFVVVGTNTLYFDAVNVGGPAGLLFSATIDTQDVPEGTPEPATLGLAGSCLLGLGFLSRFKRQRS